MNDQTPIDFPLNDGSIRFTALPRRRLTLGHVVSGVRPFGTRPWISPRIGSAPSRRSAISRFPDDRRTWQVSAMPDVSRPHT
jgi:hypothetical protein